MRSFLVRTVQVIAVTLLVSSCSGHIGHIEKTASGEVVERIYNNHGGAVKTQLRVWKARERQHKISHYVIDGTCASFCSFVAFYSPKSCYTRSARLGVHPVSIAGLRETDATRRLTDYFVANWPQGLQEWWAANRPSILGQDLVYADLKRISPERECGANDQANAAQEKT